MQVHVDDVKAQVAGANDAHDGVQVGAVAVDQAAAVVDDLAHLAHVLVEQAQRVGVGQHDADGGVVGHGAQGGQIDVAACVRLDFDDLIAAHGRRGRVGAVRRVGDDDLVALRVAAGEVVGADDQHAGELAVRAGRRLQGDAGQPGDLAQVLLQLVHEQQRALDGHLILVGMDVLKAGQRDGAVVDLGIVLHRARAERVEARVDGMVHLAEAGEVAHHLDLAHLRQGQVARSMPSGKGDSGTSSAGRLAAMRPGDPMS